MNHRHPEVVSLDLVETKEIFKNNIENQEKMTMKKRISILVLIGLILLIGTAWAGLNEDLFGAVKKGDLNEVQRLLSAGAVVNALDDRSSTPLHWTAGSGKGYTEVARLLLSKGAQVNALDDRSNTPLHVAGTADVARLLLSKGAQVNAKNKYGETPLHVAAFMGDIDVARFFLSKGAQVNAKSKKGKTPLQLAEQAGHKELAELLRQHVGR